MHFLVKARTLLLIALFAAGNIPAQQTSERRENSGISAGLMSSDDRLLVISAAFGRQGSRSKVDCSHLVHEIYSRAGFPYSYSRSSDLYSGINEFYKKGCQEKTSASTGARLFSRDPDHSVLVSLKTF